MKKIFLFSFVFQFLLAAVLLAANYSFYGETDKNPLEYQPGEEMVFTLNVLENGKPVAGKKIKWVNLVLALLMLGALALISYARFNI